MLQCNQLTLVLPNNCLFCHGRMATKMSFKFGVSSIDGIFFVRQINDLVSKRACSNLKSRQFHMPLHSFNPFSK